LIPVRNRLKWLLPLAAIALVAFLLHAAGPFLIVDKPVPSDLLIVLGGDDNDVRYSHGLALLRAGYAPHLLVDAANDTVRFGKTEAQWAQAFIADAPMDVRGHVDVCQVAGESTFTELRSARPCLAGAAGRRVLLVTSDFHTRRALAIARHVYPDYQWSVAAARTEVSSPQWWHRRWSLKWVVLEYQKLLWWKLVESHQ
jgi:hypothetical protein